MINTEGVLDYKIGGIKNSEGVKVTNKGQINGPFSLSELDEEGTVLQTKWFEGFSGSMEVPFILSDEAAMVQIDAAGAMPDVNRHNNRIKRKGLMKRTEPFKLQFLGHIDEPDRTSLFFTPALGWNNNDKFMLGMSFYNSISPEKKFDFVVTPMYGFGSKFLAGYGDVGYNIHPRNSAIRSIRVSTGAAQFHTLQPGDQGQAYFQKLSPKVTINLKPNPLNKPINHEFTLRSVNVWETWKGDEVISGNSTEVVLEDAVNINYQQYNQLKYAFSNSAPRNP